MRKVAVFFSSALLAIPLALQAEPLRTVAEFQALAAPFHSEIRVPPFESTTQQIADDATAAIAAGEEAVDRIAKQDPAAATFESTFGAFDTEYADFALAGARISFVKNSHPD